MIWKACRRRGYLLRATSKSIGLLLICLLLTKGCSGMPSGCGPGAIPTNPIITNLLVDYSMPPSGYILRESEFENLKIAFVRPMQTETFSIDDDVRVYRVTNFWGEEWQLSSVDGIVTGYEWVREDLLDLEISGIVPGEDPGVYYMIRLIGRNTDEEMPPEDFLVSDEGYPLEGDADILIGIVPDEAHRERPWIQSFEARLHCDPTKPDNCYVAPHDKIRINFSHLMGYLYFNAQPMYGFHFDIGDEPWDYGPRSVLESDSGQGLTPGQDYLLSVSADNPPYWFGFPYSMDRYGNRLSTGLTLTLEVSEVRILFPLHEPHADEPDDWYAQLKDMSALENPFILVEVTPSVVRLSSTGPGGVDSDVPFDYLLSELGVPETREENVIVEVPLSLEDIGKEEGSIGYPSSLEVHGYGQDASWLGVDALEVHAFPPPPTEIEIVTFNAFSHEALGAPDVPPECQEPPWPAECVPCWLDGGDPDICQSEECQQEWPQYCYDYYPWPPPGAVTWRERLDKFARDVVAPYLPAIIAVQEVYLDSAGCSEFFCSNCEDIGRGVWMTHLMQRISHHLGPHGNASYYIATTVKSGVGAVCFGNEWEGEAIIYDANQVKFVPSYPINTDEPHFGCYEWHWGQGDYYEFGWQEYNDCKTKANNRNASVSRAIFEFPRGSGRYFSLYNTHPRTPCGLVASIEYITDRQLSFRDDLLIYLAGTPGEGRGNEIYPPIFAGDMNTQQFPEKCPEEEITTMDLVNDLFVNAPDSNRQWLDKVWVGTNIFGGWDSDLELDVMETQVNGDCISQPTCPFSRCGEHGYSVGPDCEIYTNHSPAIIYVMAPLEQ